MLFENGEEAKMVSKALWQVDMRARVNMKCESRFVCCGRIKLQEDVAP